MTRAQSCSRLLLFWSWASVDAENFFAKKEDLTTTLKTVEFDFGQPGSTAHGVSPMLHPPPPQQTRTALAVGIGTAAAAAAGGVGMAIYAAHEANKPKTITEIVTPAPRVVYVPARVVIDVLDNGQTVNPPPGLLMQTTPRPIRLYRNVDNGHKMSKWHRKDMVMIVFICSIVACCIGCILVASLLFCHCRKKTRAFARPRKMMPAATAPEKKKPVEEEEETVEDTLEFQPGERLGFTIDEETGIIYNVVDGGQADKLGVCDGDVIEFVNGFPYDHELLKAYEDGENPFDITLAERRDENEIVGGGGDYEMRDLVEAPSQTMPLMSQSPPLFADVPQFRNLTFTPPVPLTISPYIQPTYAQPYGMTMPMNTATNAARINPAYTV